jgi:hypothetical protein
LKSKAKLEQDWKRFIIFQFQARVPGARKTLVKLGVHRVNQHRPTLASSSGCLRLLRLNFPHALAPYDALRAAAALT